MMHFYYLNRQYLESILLQLGNHLAIKLGVTQFNLDWAGIGVIAEPSLLKCVGSVNIKLEFEPTNLFAQRNNFLGY
jgi:hypothetical protein